VELIEQDISWFLLTINVKFWSFEVGENATNKESEMTYENAVLDDKELQESLKSINPNFGDFVTRVAGEAWGLPLIDQKTKALITIAVDVANQDHTGSGSPFAAHVQMALKQGVTRAEIEELLLFMCVYAGFNKGAGCFGTLKDVFEQSGVEQMRLNK
jgi:4-carboxymuconolactone decarboxylase